DLGRLALGVQTPLAHPAPAAGDVERHHDAVAGAQPVDVRADLLDDAHELVTEHVPAVEVGAQHAVEVQVGAADGGGGDADHRVGAHLDTRIGNLLHPHVLGALPGECLHGPTVGRAGPGPRAERRAEIVPAGGGS